METTISPSAPESSSLSSRYASQIAGQLGSFGRVVITGNLLDVCHPAALERQLHFAGIRCFDLGRFAEPLWDAIRDHALTLAGRLVWKSTASTLSRLRVVPEQVLITQH
jgi:hypothetical protein